MPGSSLTAHSTDITRQPRQRITRQKLDKARQLLDSSTDLDAQAHGVSLDKPRQARQARPRQQLDGASTARQLDSQGSTRPFTKEGKCCRCDESVEGSKQAGNLYYKEHAQVFTKSIGLERCPADPNLYRKCWDDGSFLYIGVLVDNSLILPSSKEKLEWFLTEYRKHYSITGGEPTTKFNGVYLVQNVEKGTVSIHLKTYIEQVYRKYVTAPACLLYTSPSPRDRQKSRMPSSA